MRRLLTMRLAAVSLMGVMPRATLAGGAVLPFEGYNNLGDVVESTSETHPLPAERTDSVRGRDAPPVPFDSLWLTIAGIIGLLLVIRTVLTESRWPRHPDPGQISRNGSGLGDVLTDD